MTNTTLITITSEEVSARQLENEFKVKARPTSTLDVVYQKDK
jgi:hypothetical protein